MTGDEYRGPRIGDEVKAEVVARVTELAARDGVPGVMVAIPGTLSDVWRPLDAVVLVARAERD